MTQGIMSKEDLPKKQRCKKTESKDKENNKAKFYVIVINYVLEK